jgi:hypothetical protein
LRYPYITMNLTTQAQELRQSLPISREQVQRSCATKGVSAAQSTMRIRQPHSARIRQPHQPIQPEGLHIQSWGFIEDSAQGKINVWSPRPGWPRVTEGVTRIFAHGRGGARTPPAAQRGVFRHRPPTLGSSSSFIQCLLFAVQCATR